MNEISIHHLPGFEYSLSQRFGQSNLKEKISFVATLLGLLYP